MRDAKFKSTLTYNSFSIVIRGLVIHHPQLVIHPGILIKHEPTYHRRVQICLQTMPLQPLQSWRWEHPSQKHSNEWYRFLQSNINSRTMLLATIVALTVMLTPFRKLDPRVLTWYIKPVPHYGELGGSRRCMSHASKHSARNNRDDCDSSNGNRSLAWSNRS